MMGLIAEKADLSAYGFNYAENFPELIRFIKWSGATMPSSMVMHWYNLIQERLRENYTIHEIDKSLRWFYRFDYRNPMIPLSYKLRRKIFKIFTQLKTNRSNSVSI